MGCWVWTVRDSVFSPKKDFDVDGLLLVIVGWVCYCLV